MSEYQPFQFNIGDYRCAAIHDGGHAGNADFLFRNAPEEELEQALQSHGLTADKLPSSWSCLYVDTGDQKLLLDTGMGSRDGFPEGKLIETLPGLGVQPEQIDMVLLSHGHPDHIGGCTGAGGQRLYPNARFLMAQDEWDFWTTESNLSGMMDIFGRFARKNLPPLKEKLAFVLDGQEILPGITIVMAPGHTPGHYGLRITNQDEVFYFLVDAFLHPNSNRTPWLDRRGRSQSPTSHRHPQPPVRKTCRRTSACSLLPFRFPFPGQGHQRSA